MFRTGLGFLFALSLLAAATPACSSIEDDGDSADEIRESGRTKVIVFVWDGLRPDVINQSDTPNLFALTKSGSYFSDNHSTFPTFTMMNAASFATGSFPGTTGFYGNTQWTPGATGTNAAGDTNDFNQPVFTEDYALLSALSTFYQNDLFMVGTLFSAAQNAGLTTAAVGKSGPAFIQDYKRGGIIIDEKMAYPVEFAKELQQKGFALPKLTTKAYPAGAVTLAENNGDPTAQAAVKKLSDGASSDPSDSSGSPPTASNAYLMDVFLRHILPERDPDLSVVWMRNPDSTQHTYGIGAPNSVDALKQQDILLGKLQARLKELGRDKATDLIVVSDHGHSTVAGPRALFPLRRVENGAMGAPDERGFSASGAVRLADLLRRAGITAFDGTGCVNEPVMSGIKADGSPVYPPQVDADGSVCGTPGTKYTTASFKVPAQVPANAAVIAMNGGSDYIYVPSKDPALVKNIVRFLQSREEYGAIFVSGKYGDIPGTIPLETVRAANLAGRNPDIIASMSYEDEAMVQGRPGTEMSSMMGNNSRGMHGSFSPIDVHNTLVASGPSFRERFVDKLPTGNVDVAPTVARILKLELSKADGRPLLEALSGEKAPEYSVKAAVVKSASEATGLSFKLPTDPAGGAVDEGKSTYGIEIQTKTLSGGDREYTYFDRGKAVRR